mmetsp:Transcript_43385/g.137179  ORF Transcript_43385/g.137179 Transcript_43385/m.137179 type:complete len:403 (+) Transcript_43385:50-1258(+)|eukprot:CAMPEP_0204137244 /NCGR_PEP_ID=MMETSP0361-20130328/17293_1 /ASSEMBLY_ACC=CAM_ASM_000343 /TAXON_ID=268821 /ORGANISM="Scrippsiella Hangoei, Strain SHTV-5" /LENGTH=402 /DNA_ID=CAMNT_0051090877 /DNA_START=18 /DNA_END=1226 /DNA_ORIENTATION=-
MGSMALRTVSLTLIACVAVAERARHCASGSASCGHTCQREYSAHCATSVHSRELRAAISLAPSLLQHKQTLTVTAGSPLWRDFDLEKQTYCEAAQKNPTGCGERDKFAKQLCQSVSKQATAALAAWVATRVTSRKNATVDSEGLVKRLEDKFGKTDTNALQAFKAISGLEASDVLAFRETWTEADTELLRKLDSRNGSFTDGELTTEGIRLRLPSLKALEDLTARKSFAIVGSGASLEGKHLAADIADHAEVARFNNFPTDTEDLGNRTTLQVVNRWIEPTDGLQIIDLEMSNSFDPYCFRLSHQGAWAARDDSIPWLVRPSARCALAESIAGFTRGFIFYWLVGTLFEEVDMYGFVGGGKDHIKRGQTSAERPVQEPFVEFEHKVYREIRELQATRRVLAF